ncbi:MAG: ABC transporter ATP-binding protein [Nitrospirota bacterium]
MIEIKDLRKNYSNFALKGINLKINEGEYFVILGHTGSGKTTLLEIIAGLVQSDEGKIWLNGKEISHLLPETRQIGFVYQDYALFPHLSVVENIKFGLKLKNLAKQIINERVSNMMDLLHIAHLASAYPKTLSGGEAQRVALARALVIQPQILLLDEPLSNIDPNLRQQIQSELKRIHQDLRITTIHVTHNFDEAIALADRIGVMHQGEILQVGSPMEIFNQPCSEIVARFVSRKLKVES